jgi:hypothetical protein
MASISFQFLEMKWLPFVKHPLIGGGSDELHSLAKGFSHARRVAPSSAAVGFEPVQGGILEPHLQSHAHIIVGNFADVNIIISKFRY